MHMTRHAQVAFLVTLLVGIALSPNLAQGKRSPPADIPPVVGEGVRYEAPHYNNPCGQNGGCVVAYDDASGAQLWSVKVYCTQYDAQVETDVQDVFITSLTVENGQLNITNEKGLHFAIDLRTREISADADADGAPRFPGVWSFGLCRRRAGFSATCVVGHRSSVADAERADERDG